METLYIVRIQQRNSQFEARDVVYKALTESYLIKNLGRNKESWSKSVVEGAPRRGKTVLNGMRLATLDEVKSLQGNHPKKKGADNWSMPGGRRDLYGEIYQLKVIKEQEEAVEKAKEAEIQRQKEIEAAAQKLVEEKELAAKADIAEETPKTTRKRTTTRKQ